MSPNKVEVTTARRYDSFTIENGDGIVGFVEYSASGTDGRHGGLATCARRLSFSKIMYRHLLWPQEDIR